MAATGVAHCSNCSTNRLPVIGATRLEPSKGSFAELLAKIHEHHDELVRVRRPGVAVCVADVPLESSPGNRVGSEFPHDWNAIALGRNQRLSRRRCAPTRKAQGALLAGSARLPNRRYARRFSGQGTHVVFDGGAHHRFA